MRQTTLDEKSLTELRAIAQGCGAQFDFSTSKPHLLQAIRQRSIDIIPKPIEEKPVIENPDLLRNLPPAKNLKPDAVIDMLKPYITKGLRLSFPTQLTWKMEAGKKVDTGTLRMPLRILVRCAEQVMK